jgi:hypothetical protein
MRLSIVASLLGLAGLVAVVSCAESSGESCALNSDCLDGYCRDGECVRDCVDSEKDCPKGYVCNGIGQCEFGGEGGGAGQGGDAATTGPTTSAGQGGDPTTVGSTGSTTGSGPSTTSATTGAGGGAGNGLLSPCAADGECASGLCRPMVVNGTKRCTQGCASIADCPSGHRCEDVGGSSVCVESDVGRDCNGVSQCNYACLTPLNYCTSECSTGADCPNGYGCMPIGNPATNVCIRVAAYCDPSDTSQCVAPAACDDSPELVVQSCTIACDSSQDCPQRANGLPAWSCDGLCRRPGDVFGPLPVGFSPTQYACNAQNTVVNVCNDGLQIDFNTLTQPSPPQVSCGAPTTTNGVPGDACLDSCRLRGGCDYGFACSALATLDNAQAIGLCLPRGSGQVGAPCSKPSDCVYGLCEGAKCSRDCSKDGACPTGSQCVATGDLPIEGAQNRRCQ